MTHGLKPMMLPPDRNEVSAPMSDGSQALSRYRMGTRGPYTYPFLLRQPRLAILRTEEQVYWCCRRVNSVFPHRPKHTANAVDGSLISIQEKSDLMRKPSQVRRVPDSALHHSQSGAPRHVTLAIRAVQWPRGQERQRIDGRSRRQRWGLINALEPPDSMSAPRI